MNTNDYNDPSIQSSQTLSSLVTYENHKIDDLNEKIKYEELKTKILSKLEKHIKQHESFQKEAMNKTVFDSCNADFLNAERERIYGNTAKLLLDNLSYEKDNYDVILWMFNNGHYRTNEEIRQAESEIEIVKQEEFLQSPEFIKKETAQRKKQGCGFFFGLSFCIWFPLLVGFYVGSDVLNSLAYAFVTLGLFGPILLGISYVLAFLIPSVSQSKWNKEVKDKYPIYGERVPNIKTAVTKGKLITTAVAGSLVWTSFKKNMKTFGEGGHF